jgi:hypothetical protein
MSKEAEVELELATLGGPEKEEGSLRGRVDRVSEGLSVATMDVLPRGGRGSRLA